MDENSNRSSKTIGVIVVVVFVLAGLVGMWYWLIYKPEQEAKEKARQEQIAKEEAEQKRKELVAQKRANYDKLLEDANAEFEQGNWEAAHSLYSEASSLFPNQKYPNDRLALVNAEMALEAKKAAGVVETVSSSTGRFYIIVSSSVDGDLAMDHASKLAKEGNNVKIIEPYATNELFHRVSIDDYDTWEKAVTASPSFSTYGNGVWILKY